VSTTGLYEWYYTIGLRTSSQCLVAASFLVLLSGLFMAAGVIHAASADSFQQPRTRILSAGDSFINHHLGGFLGTASVAWAGHLVHVALPASRGQSTDWSNLLHQLPHPGGLKPFVTLEWGLYSTNGDEWNHVFGLADASVWTSVLSFLGTRMPSSDSLWLTNVAHHHLALGVVCLFLGNTVRSFSINRDQCGLHWYLALSLAALGTASSFAVDSWFGPFALRLRFVYAPFTVLVRSIRGDSHRCIHRLRLLD
jgi:photosystem I P700 chlorophyll a apoprotein A2